jgi:hypothetical protein
LDVNLHTTRRIAILLVTALLAAAAGLFFWPSSEAIPEHVWPAASAATNSASGTAMAFAHRLGFTTPYVTSSSVFANSATVSISPVGPGGSVAVHATTRVSERRANGKWFVTSCTSSQLVVYSPRPNSIVSGLLPVRASTTAYEAVVNVQLRATDSWSLEWKNIMMGGSMGEMGAASGMFPLRSASRHPVALILLSRNAKDGGVIAATVVALREQS